MMLRFKIFHPPFVSSRTFCTGKMTPAQAATSLLKIGMKKENIYNVSLEVTTNRKRKPGADVSKMIIIICNV